MDETTQEQPSGSLVPQSVPDEEVTHVRKRSPFFLIGPLLMLILILTLLWFIDLRTDSSEVNQDRSLPVAGISPTPMPFQEMTIPYLREREYTGRLASLEEVSVNDAYTTYLTSYHSDGYRINALLTKPLGAEPEDGWPAIVFIHGYIPPSTYQTLGPQYTDYVDFLGRNRFVVLKIDLRGHGNSEGEPGGGYYGSDYIVDALNAYTALQQTDFVDPQSIGMWGHSMAGNTLMRSLAAKPDIPAIVIWAGAVYTYEDMRTYGIDDTSYRPPSNVTRPRQKRQEMFQKYGSPSAESSFWRQVIPTNYLEDVTGAVAIHHAVDDDVVNIGYSRDLVGFLKKSNVEHELHEYETGGHNINGASFVTAMQRTIDFFQAHLK